ncbi:MAG: DUF2914 domain-containing protein [Polynucleobacter sp.]|nr:MAG: DUF2914 domain-containing protein [Polynucleobacter sp.]
MNPRSIYLFCKRHLTTLIFLGGFFSDAFLLPDVDNPITKYIGLSYLVILAVLLLLREIIIASNRASRAEQKMYSLLSFGVAFFSGSSLSFIFVYAMRSAALSVSWPLFIILMLCMAANEFISVHNYRFTLDIAVFFIALAFYAIFNVPILFSTVTDTVFLVAIGISVLFAMLFVWLLKHTSETAWYEAPRGYALAVGVPLFIGMLYVLNLIPAVPLSLKDAGIYNNVIRTERGEYELIGEAPGRFEWLRNHKHTIKPGDDGVYFYSAISAPAEFSAPISHVWEYHDPTTNSWIESTTISFDLSGGRVDGYRAYSKKQNIIDGLWRVTVKVDDKRIVGRKTFEVTRQQ